MKSMILALIAVLIIVAFGLIEVATLCDSYEEINKEIKVLMSYAEDKSITTAQMNSFVDRWIQLREKAEIFMPHMDLAECNNRVFESRGYVMVGDFDNAYVQLSVLEQLTEYYPHLLRPIFSHII